MEESKKDKFYKNKKIMIPILFVILIMLLVSFFINAKSKNVKKDIIEEKIDILFNAYNDELNNEALEETYNSEIFYAYALSISNDKDKAHVVYSIKPDNNDAILDVKEKAIKYVKDNNIKVKYLKLDVCYNFDNETVNDIKNMIISTNEYSLNKGIILSDTLFLPCELDINKIFNYSTSNNAKAINLDNLNMYLKKREKVKLDSLPNIAYLFDTKGYFLDNDNTVIKIANDDISLYSREITDMKEETKRIIKEETNLLYSLIEPNGTFRYYYDIITGNEVSDNYNLLRHAGSVISLIRNYDVIDDSDKNKEEKINKTLDLLENYTLYQGEFGLLQSEEDELNLGGTALSCCCYNEYYKHIKNDTMYKLKALKLADGIVACSNDKGELVQTYFPSFAVKDSFVSEYYDGEAMLALYMTYENFGNDNYLKRANELLDHYIREYGVTDSNHWIGYALSYATKYSNDRKYYDYLSDILNKKYESMYERNYTSYSTNEFVQNIDVIYDRMLENNISSNLRKYSKEQINNLIEKKQRYILSSVANKENSIYFDTQEFSGAVMLRTDYELRVDEIQHTLMSLNNYLNEDY